MGSPCLHVCQRKAEGKSSFVPLVFTTSGGMAPECAAFMKQVALRRSDLKRKDDYADVANYIRTKIRFALLKSVQISLRGVRGKQRKEATLPTSAVDFATYWIKLIWHHG